MKVAIELFREVFTPLEGVFAEAGGITVSAFRYPTGVKALRLTTARGQIVVVPPGGIWRSSFSFGTVAAKNASALVERIATIWSGKE